MQIIVEKRFYPIKVGNLLIGSQQYFAIPNKGGFKLEISNKKIDKSTWAIGGGLLAGLGVGFFFLTVSALAFVGCILTGLGIGLIITSILSK